MCNPGMTLEEPTGRVYNQPLRLQQSVRKPQRCAKAQGRIADEGAGTDVSELSSAVVHGCDDADDLAELSLLEQVFEVLNYCSIGLPPCELQDVCVWPRIFASQLSAPPCLS